MTLLLVLVGSIAGAWYLLIVRPQKDQQGRHARIVDRLGVGDHVMTVGGIYGRVVGKDAAGVDLELSPGLISRVAIDGIARIVQPGQSQLGNSPHQSVASSDGHTTATDPHMHDTSQDQSQQSQQWQAPAQPFAQHQPVGHSAPQPQPQQPQQAAPTTTFRAQVVAPQQPAQQPAHQQQPLSSWAPQRPTMPIFTPFGNQQQAGQPVQPQPAAAMAPHTAHQTSQPPQPHVVAPAGMPRPAGAQAPQPMPQQVATTASPQQTAPAQFAQQPQQYAVAQPAAQQLMPAQVPQPVHNQAQQYQQAPAHNMQQPPPQQQQDQPQEGEPKRRHSLAPEGMGSSLRLDDPSISDTMQRAVSERHALADAYRKVNGPMVDMVEGSSPQPQHDQQQGAPTGVPTISHAQQQSPGGVPLFASPNSPQAVGAEQYPAAVQPPDHGVPRPARVETQGEVDPAFKAFQRRAPYSPDAVSTAALSNA